MNLYIYNLSNKKKEKNLALDVSGKCVRNVYILEEKKTSYDVVQRI